MPDMSQVTFIIPVYDAAEYLDACISSVVSQRGAPFEIIIVDDGSTDGSDDLCEQWALRDRRIHVAHQRHSGLSVARNCGLDMAQGEYVAFVDADDVLHPSFLTRMLGLIAGHDIACCSVYEGKQCRWPRMSHSVSAFDTTTALRRMLYQQGWHNGVWAHLYRRRLFDGLRFREGILYEDLDLIYKIYERADQGISRTDDQLYFYRRHAGSLLDVFTPARLQVLDVADRLACHFADNPMMAPAARHRQFSAYFNMLCLMARHVSKAEAKHRCWPMIKHLRSEILSSRHARLKNRIGALLSHLGPDITISLTQRLIR